MNNSTIYIGTLYRFGYDLTCAGFSEDEVKAALKKEYIRFYKQENGTHPNRDKNPYGDTYLSQAMEDIEIREFSPNKVEWY